MDAPRVASWGQIDAEGSEPRILAGGERLLLECRPTVACEVNSAKLVPMAHRPSEIHEFLARLGYEAFVWINSSRAFRPSSETTEGNVLFRPLSGKTVA